MLDPKFVRENPEAVLAALSSRGLDVDLQDFLAADGTRRRLLNEVE